MSEEDQEDKPHPPLLWQSAFPAAAVVGISEIPEELFELRLPERRQQYRLCPVTPTFPSIAATASRKREQAARYLHPVSDRRHVKGRHFRDKIELFSGCWEFPDLTFYLKIILRRFPWPFLRRFPNKKSTTTIFPFW